VWDGEDRLVRLGPDDPGSAFFMYDADGLLRWKRAGIVSTRLLWDGQNVLRASYADGIGDVDYTWTPDVYGSLISRRHADDSHFCHFDALGSTTELTGADETQTDRYRYYAFGEIAAWSGSTLLPFRFVGRLGYYDGLVPGLLYLRARWYQPATGRFTSRDPLGSALRGSPGAGRYAYVANKPVGTADPTGLVTYVELVGACVVAIVLLSMVMGLADCLATIVHFLDRILADRASSSCPEDTGAK